jgi:hypothetical protein
VVRAAGDLRGVTRSRPRAAGAAAGLSLAAALVLGGAVATRDLLTTDCRVPDVGGLPVASARAALAEVGVAAGKITTSRRAADAAEDSIVEQRSTTCRDPVALVVSDGGPAVSVDDIPPGLRRRLGEHDGPVRRIETAAGVAWKSDEVLLGDCPAVRAAAARVSDSDYVERCRIPPEELIRRTVESSIRRWLQVSALEVPVVMETAAEGVTWFGSSRVEGWLLYLAVTIDAEAGWAAGALPPDIRGDGYAVARGRGGTRVSINLIRPPGPQTVPPRRSPVGSEELDVLAIELLGLARTF